MSKRTAKKNNIERHTTMDTIMTNSPEVISILLQNKMHCVGCLLASFHDLADAAVEHELDENELIRQLQQVGIDIVA